jgi:hypothetical protein
LPGTGRQDGEVVIVGVRRSGRGVPSGFEKKVKGTPRVSFIKGESVTTFTPIDSTYSAGVATVDDVDWQASLHEVTPSIAIP